MITFGKGDKYIRQPTSCKMNNTTINPLIQSVGYNDYFLFDGCWLLYGY